ncbi:nuclear transport factor 2 family protein [Glutamicibacter sp. NPDC087344]|uniref:nuclear transport factor 2 family protein n=1 Tax=Glutamicibacter sp. NPDC087344 TaxID=3363994 RepID=UPI00380471AA
MSPTQQHIVESFLTAFRDKDVAGALQNVSENASITIFPLRITDGPKNVMTELLSDIVIAFPDLLLTVKNVIELEHGSVVVAEFKVEGTQAADFLGVINQEKHLDVDTAWRFTLENGQINHIDAYWCQNQLYRRLAVKRQDQVAIV